MLPNHNTIFHQNNHNKVAIKIKRKIKKKEEANN
jgi:hypothetical protein